MNAPSVIHHWKGMAMSIHNPFCLNLYDIPKSAQNFDDTSGIQCKLYLTVCLTVVSVYKQYI